MGIFEKIAEQRIKESIENGEFDSLDGRGEPLPWDDKPPTVPSDIWFAMKILKNSGVVPREVELLKEVEHLRAQLDTSKNKDERDFLQALIQCKEEEARMRLEMHKAKL